MLEFIMIVGVSLLLLSLLFQPFHRREPQIQYIVVHEPAQQGGGSGAFFILLLLIGAVIFFSMA